MLVIRPVSPDDLHQLYELAGGAGYGLTSLPQDRERLADKIIESQESFARLGRKPRGDSYLFVLEDTESRKVVGATGIVTKVGGFEPFYAYRIETAVCESEELKVRKEIQFLKLVADHNGPCEIGSLVLSPEYRKGDNGRLLSLVRFVFIAEYASRFDPVVIAELRGIIDDTGHSPFWEALGRHFFDTDYFKADYLSGVDKRFIADLMPAHPIYIPLLPPEAREVIGQVHPQSRPAMKILTEEGFRENGMIDIFDAGPVVQCRRDDIRTVRLSRRCTVEQIVAQVATSEICIIAALSPTFRACRGFVEQTADRPDAGLRIGTAEAAALDVKTGDAVRVVALRPPRADSQEATSS